MESITHIHQPGTYRTMCERTGNDIKIARPSDKATCIDCLTVQISKYRKNDEDGWGGPENTAFRRIFEARLEKVTS